MKKLISILILSVFVLAGCASTEVKISEDKAKEIALADAGLKSEDVTFRRIEKDRDNGKIIYEIEFHTKDMMEYDYEIDAETGTVIGWESESVFD